MLFLLIAILSNCMVTLVFRATEKKANGDITMLLNYCICAVGAFINMVSHGHHEVFRYLFSSETLKVFSQPSMGGTALLALIFGTINGFYYVANLVLIRNSMFKNGTALTEMFSKVNFIIPVAMAAIFWRELPTWVHVLGIILAITGMAVASLNFKDKARIQKPILLFGTFLCLGFINCNLKLFQHYAHSGDYSTVFVFCIFFTALIFCYIYTLGKLKKEGKKLEIKPLNILFGACVGIPNLMQSTFFMKSLETLPAAVAYPTLSAGALVIVTLASMVVFKEKLNRRQVISIILTLTALVLINI